MTLTDDEILALAEKGWNELGITPTPWYFFDDKNRSGCLTGTVQFVLQAETNEFDAWAIGSRELLEILGRTDLWSSGVTCGFSGFGNHADSKHPDFIAGFALGRRGYEKYGHRFPRVKAVT